MARLRPTGFWLLAVLALGPSRIAAQTNDAATDPSPPNASIELRRVGPIEAPLFAGQRVQLQLVLRLEEALVREQLVQPFRRPLDLPVQVRSGVLTGDSSDQRSLRRTGQRPEMSPGSRAPESSTCVLDGETTEAFRAAALDTDGLIAFTLPITLEFKNPGRRTLAAPRLEFLYATEFRDDFLNGRQPVDRQSFSTEGEPLVLEVVPLPVQGRPAGFSGAVGRFELTLSAESRELSPGDTLRVTVTTEGSGNFGAFDGPRLTDPSDFQVLGRSESLGSDPNGGELLGTVLELEPKHRAATEVRFALDSFEPGSGEYRRVVSPPLALQLEGDWPEAPDQQAAEPSLDGDLRTGILDSLAADAPLRSLPILAEDLTGDSADRGSSRAWLWWTPFALALLWLGLHRTTGEARTRRRWARFRSRLLKDGCGNSVTLRQVLLDLDRWLDLQPKNSVAAERALTRRLLEVTERDLFGPHSSTDSATDPVDDREDAVRALARDCGRRAKHSTNSIGDRELTSVNERIRRRSRTMLAAVGALCLLGAVLRTSLDTPTEVSNDPQLRAWFETAGRNYRENRPAVAHWLWLRTQAFSDDPRVEQNLEVLRREWSLPGPDEPAALTALRASIENLDDWTLALVSLGLVAFGSAALRSRQRTLAATLFALALAGQWLLSSHSHQRSPRLAVVTAPVLPLHAAPIEGAQLGSSLRLAQSVEVLDWSDRWALVRRGDGVAWVARPGLAIVTGALDTGAIDVGSTPGRSRFEPELRLEARHGLRERSP